VRRIAADDLSRDHPIKEHQQLPDSALLAPSHERRRHAAIGGARVAVADIDGEEIEESQGCRLTGVHDERGETWRGLKEAVRSPAIVIPSG
jgi:hypothetical protein